MHLPRSSGYRLPSSISLRPSTKAARSPPRACTYVGRRHLFDLLKLIKVWFFFSFWIAHTKPLVHAIDCVRTFGSPPGAASEAQLRSPRSYFIFSSQRSCMPRPRACTSIGALVEWRCKFCWACVISRRISYDASCMHRLFIYSCIGCNITFIEVKAKSWLYVLEIKIVDLICFVDIATGLRSIYYFCSIWGILNSNWMNMITN